MASLHASVLVAGLWIRPPPRSETLKARDEDERRLGWTNHFATAFGGRVRDLAELMREEEQRQARRPEHPYDESMENPSLAEVETAVKHRMQIILESPGEQGEGVSQRKWI